MNSSTEALLRRYRGENERGAALSFSLCRRDPQSSASEKPAPVATEQRLRRLFEPLAVSSCYDISARMATS